MVSIMMPIQWHCCVKIVPNPAFKRDAAKARHPTLAVNKAEFYIVYRQKSLAAGYEQHIYVWRR